MTASLFQPQTPLAERLRPTRLEELSGQRHLFQPGAPLEVAQRTGKLQNLILHGPPGTGKTTIALALAGSLDAQVFVLSATTAGKAELQEVTQKARQNQLQGKRTIVFLDEVHRWSRAQQDALLSDIEKGVITFIGATTENPGFTVNPALRSRARILEVLPLTENDLEEVLKRAENIQGQTLPLTPEARQTLIRMAGHDARTALGIAEAVWNAQMDHDLTTEELQQVAPTSQGLHGRNREALYDLLSALHKSMRGSDPDAALYYAARLIQGGEDPFAVIRRVQCCASEDVGLADPQAMVQADAAWNAMLRLGFPEGYLPLWQAIIYVASAPKSNAAYQAGNAAMKRAGETMDISPPLWMMNAPTSYQKGLGRKEGYQYDHDHQGFAPQQRLPDALKEETYYQPTTRGFEALHLQKRLDHWRSLRQK